MLHALSVSTFTETKR